MASEKQLIKLKEQQDQIILMANLLQTQLAIEEVVAASNI